MIVQIHFDFLQMSQKTMCFQITFYIKETAILWASEVTLEFFANETKLTVLSTLASMAFENFRAANTTAGGIWSNSQTTSLPT